ncbi:MAG: hypothetical protein CMN87_06815 [Stappia sp.]|uniref:putative bifunctional diguanylate cyclase/phosphodiesterase n=1 Tax=Stappia sp. TaxID=1870903 RepID=UPI000C52B3F9|nr:GGDEF and EAL domain-containing protein [Stappia sp.]MAA97883.1 hypothetical protein [Stappia sp.]MBM19703.1 hypothetical protein [Stappia sp.]
MDHLAERGQGEVAILATGRRLVGPDGDLWNTFGGRAFHAAFEESRFRMIVLDRHLVVRGANRAFREAEGAGVSVVGRSFTGFFGEATYAARRPLLHRALSGEVITFVDWGARESPQERMLRVSYLPVEDEAGEVDGLVIVLEDTTRVHDLERKVSMQEEVISQTSDGLAIIGTDCRYLWANLAYTERWGLGPDDIIGRPVAEVVGTRGYLESVLVPLSRCFSGETVEFEDPNQKDDGSAVIYSIRLEPFRDEAGVICGAIVNRRDVTEIAVVRERLLKREREDPVTGLPNRQALLEELARCIAPGAEREGDGNLGLMVIDIDDFRIVNDLTDQAAGDELLRHIATLLRGLAPQAHVARIGGEQFAVVASDEGGHGLEAIAEHVVASVEATGFDWGGNRYSVGVSVGLVDLTSEVSGGAALTVLEVLNRADRACMIAREAGGSRVALFRADDREIIARHQEVMNVRLIHDALRADRFELHAMPIQPLYEGGTPHDEILLRVLDESGKALPPGAFIAAAERHGLMSRVDRWVVEAVLNRIPSMPEGYRITVNLSGQSVGDPRFRDFLVNALDEAPPPPGLLSFEITETSAVRSMTAARELIAACRARGCGIILDDFGSGLSSFGYLRQFDVDMLKIDGSIVGGLLEDRVQQVIVAGIVAVAEAMSIRVVAEYVEDAETAGLLRELGVSFAQGYAIGRPRRWNVPGTAG